MIADEVLERLYVALEERFRRGETLHAGAVAEEFGVPPELVEDIQAALEAMSEGDVGAPPTRLGDYEILGEIARGGMGVVYRARHREVDREVAVKVLRAGAGAREEERFRRELEAVARLRHAHVVTVHAAGSEAGRAFFAMELIEGARSLDEAAADMEPARRVALVRDAARALGYAHRNGVIHRDVKPSNLLVDGDGLLRVADFGLTREASAESLTRTGAILGTMGYMAPEQALGDKRAHGSASDVWGLGVVLYELCAGRRPFPDETVPEFLNAMTEQRPPAPLTGWRALDRVCRKALAFDPRDRYQDGDALADALDRVLAGGTPVGTRVSVAAAAGGLFVVLLGVALVAWRSSVPPTPGEEAAADRETSAAREVDPLPVGPQEPTPQSAPSPLLVARHASEATECEVGMCFADRETLLTVGLAEVRRWNVVTQLAEGRWNPGAGRDQGSWPLEQLRHIARLPDGGWIIAGTSGVARFPRGAWDSAACPEPLWAVPAPEITAFALEPGGREVACWLQGKGIRRLAAEDGRSLGQHPPRGQGRCRTLAYLDGGRLVSAVYKMGTQEWQEDCDVRLWSREQLPSIRQANLPPVYSAAYSPADDTLALGLRSGLILFLDPDTLARRGPGPADPGVADEGLFRGRAFPNRVAGLAFLAGGRALIATPGRGMRRVEKYPKLFDLAANTVRPLTPGLVLPPVSFARSPADRFIAFGYEDGSVRVFPLGR